MTIKTKQLLAFCERASTHNKCFAHKCYKYLARESYYLDKKDLTDDIKTLRDALAFVINYLYLAEKEKYTRDETTNFFTRVAIDISNDKKVNAFSARVGIILLDMVAKEKTIARTKKILEEQVLDYAIKGRILYEQ